MDDHLPRGAGGTSRVRRADVAHFMLNDAEYPAHVARVVRISYHQGGMRKLQKLIAVGIVALASCVFSVPEPVRSTILEITTHQ